MFRFLYKTGLHNLYNKVEPLTRHRHAFFFQTQSLKSIRNSTIQHSPTVSYLMNSCGLSLDSAISASKKVQIETPQKPDSVLQLFKTYGFTKTQITDLITKYPQFVVCDSDKTLKPKLDFFESLGFSRHDLTKLILLDRKLLLSSLDQRIIPNVNFLKTFLDTNENIITVIKQSCRIIYSNLQTHIEPNMAVLRAHGVPDYIISRLLLIHPRTFTLEVDMVEETIKVVDEMGFDHRSLSFILAIRSILVMSKSKWDHKVEAFMSFGWSKDDFLSAFKSQPMCMTSSEKKIRILMDFFINKLGVKPSDLAKCPNTFLLSLEKRIVPRCSVLEVLVRKGLINKDIKILGVLSSTKKRFDKRFVTKYQKLAPEVVKAYQGQMGYPNLEALRSML